MCYVTLLSTTSANDLAAHNSKLVTYSRALPGVPEEKYLRHANKWYLGSKSGCSCDFRHLYVGSVSLGFGEPEEWYPENPEDIEATRQVISLIRKLVSAGAEVECVDAWAHGQDEAEPLAGDQEVNLAEVGDAQFRFFEGHRFAFKRGT